MFENVAAEEEPVFSIVVTAVPELAKLRLPVVAALENVAVTVSMDDRVGV